MHKAHRIVCPLPLLRANACTWHFRLRAHSLINRTPNNSRVSPSNIKNWKFCNWMHFPISELSSLHIVLLSQQNSCATESGEDVSKVATSPLILFYAFYHIFFISFLAATATAAANTTIFTISASYRIPKQLSLTRKQRLMRLLSRCAGVRNTLV